MIIFQQVVAADTKYSFANQPNLTLFDVHNDSPLNMGVSFGRDTGIQQADYYTSPHSILYGIGPVGNQQRSIAGVKWNGTIYIYTQTPMGGGTTNLASAPASQITVIGYATGYNPSGTTSLARMTNTGNPVNTVGGTSTAIQNDNNVTGTSIVEATVAGDGSSAVSWTNNAILVNGDAAHPGSVSFDNAKVTTDGSGNITSVSFSGIWRSATAGQGLSNALNSVAAHIATYNANAIFPQSGANNTGLVLITRDNTGTVQTALSVNPSATELEVWENLYVTGNVTATGNASITGSLSVGSFSADVLQAVTAAGVVLKDSTGTAQGTFQNAGITLNANVTANNNLTVSGNYIYKNGNLISRISSFTGSGSGTYNHNAGSAPTWVGPIVSQSGSATQGFDSAGTTTVHVTLGASLSFKAFCIKDV